MKKAFTLLCFYILSHTSLLAQTISFSSIDDFSYELNGVPFDIKSADFNSDNIPDLIATVDSYAVTDHLALLIGDGDGSFQEPVFIITDDRPMYLVAADFNTDGKNDLVVSMYNSGDLFFYPGNGNGSFGTSTLIISGSDAPRLYLSDLDNDGFDDLVECSHGDGIVKTRTGNGDGTFDLPHSYGFSTPYGTSIADLDNDGYADLIVFSDNMVTIMLGKGDGSFLQSNSFSYGGSVHAQVADFNNDGWKDLVAGLYFYPDLGNGFFGNDFQIPAMSVYATDLIASDIDEDGLTDLLVSYFGTIVLFKGDGNGDFSPLDQYMTGAYCAALAITDFDADGHTDVATINKESMSITALRGNGNGSFESYAYFFESYPVGSIANGDLNGDGKDDFVLLQTSAPYDIIIQYDAGNGFFQNDTLFTDYFFYGAKAAISDLNGDGYGDIAVANYNLLKIYTGDGQGSFQYSIDTLNGSPRFISVEYFNNDGYADLIVTTDGAATIMLGNGDATFTIADTETDGMCVGHQHAVADFNEDGFKDVVVGSDGEDYGCNPKLKMFFGDGTGSLASSGIGLNTFAGAEVITADFNNDGHADLAIGELSVAGFRILLGDGTGHFSKVFELNNLPGFNIAMTTSDFNSDGIADIVFCANKLIHVYKGEGDGSFVFENQYSGNTNTLLAADATGDSYPELFFSSYYGLVELINKTGYPVNAPPAITDGVNALSVFPNPARTSCTVQWMLAESSWVELSLFSLTAEKIETLLDESFNSGNHSLNFSSEELPKGLYVLRLQTNSEVQTQKIIIQ